MLIHLQALVEYPKGIAIEKAQYKKDAIWKVDRDIVTGVRDRTLRILTFCASSPSNVVAYSGPLWPAERGRYVDLVDAATFQ